MLGILYNSGLLCTSQLCSVKSYWELEISCGGSIYIMEIGKCYTLGLFIFISEGWLLNIYQHTSVYMCAHTHTYTHTLPQCGVFVCFLAQITSPMSQHHVSRKTLSCIKILCYMHHSQLKFLIKTLISLLRQVEKLLDITVFRFLPQLPFRDSTERFVLSSSVISDSL